MNETYYAVLKAIHDSLVAKAYQKRGFSEDESQAGQVNGLPSYRRMYSACGYTRRRHCVGRQRFPLSFGAGAFAKGRNQASNKKAVAEDILGPGNESCLLPGQLEAAKLSDRSGGLLFTTARIEAFNEFNVECGKEPWDLSSLKTTELN